MTRIRLTCRANIGGGFHESGDVVLVDQDVAAMMEANGRAVLVEERVERAVRVAPETAARTTARTRTRARGA